MKMKTLVHSVVLLVLMSACGGDDAFDASGTFEAVETLVSAEVNGKVLSFAVSEGQELQAGQIVGQIDTSELHLRKLQLQQNRVAVLSGRPQTPVQTRALREQLSTAIRERERITNLVKAGVANQKQLDDVIAQVATIEAQITAQESALGTNTSSINEQANLISIQLEEINDKLRKSRIVNPIKGTVLSKYVEPYEMTSVGRPLYRIADLSNIILRAYITGDQLSKVKLNQQVRIFTDAGEDAYKEAVGTVTWISDKSEFTPRSVHTRNDRSNLVYAIKVKVNNDGSYKIGMYGELMLE